MLNAVRECPHSGYDLIIIHSGGISGRVALTVPVALKTTSRRLGHIPARNAGPSNCPWVKTYLIQNEGMGHEGS
jgi:hypothetical protein